MDDTWQLGLYGWMAIGAALGVALAIEGRQHRPNHPVARLLLLTIAAAAVAIEADTLRGFVLLLLAPIGAYKVAQIAAELALLAIRRRRPVHPE